MKQIIDAFSSEPIYGLIVVVLTSLVLYSLSKKIIKLLVFSLIVFGLYLSYVGLTGRDIPVNQNQLKATLEQDIKKASLDGKSLSSCQTSAEMYR